MATQYPAPGTLLRSTPYTSGSGTFQLRAGRVYRVTLQGAGSGGTAGNSGNTTGGAGGNGGGYVRETFRVAADELADYSVGAGGVAGVAGGDTRFWLLIAPGGATGAGASASVTPDLYSGGKGGAGGTSGNPGAAGFRAGFPAGGSGLLSVVALGGANTGLAGGGGGGGDSYMGRGGVGGAGNNVGNATAGGAPTGYGAGGGGGGASSPGTGGAGASGGGGFILIEEFAP